MLTTSVVGRGIPMRQIAPLERRIRCLPAVLPRPTTEAPAGPARRARRASPRSTPPVCGLLFCHAGHRLMATAALVHRGKRNAAPCRSGLRAEPPRLTAIGACAWSFRARVAVQWLLTWIEGRRVVGRIAARSTERPRTPRRPQPLSRGTFHPPRRPALLHRLLATACGPPAGEAGGDDAAGVTALMASPGAKAWVVVHVRR